MAMLFIYLREIAVFKEDIKRSSKKRQQYGFKSFFFLFVLMIKLKVFYNLCISSLSKLFLLKMVLFFPSECNKAILYILCLSPIKAG